tara:strand:- start:277 stop:2007 length:1731 start_codon:yes stop_codon:yes gene_type:complete
MLQLTLNEKRWQIMSCKIKEVLDKVLGDISPSIDEQTRSAINTLFNLVETLFEKSLSSKKEIQNLKDEVSRLKGEQPKPTIRKQTTDSSDENNEEEDSNHSSEDERKNPKDKKGRKPKIKKKKVVVIDKHVTCDIDVSSLPDDVIFKGYETRVIQDLIITTDNTEFKLPTYYSPSLKKTFIAKLPQGYYGEFGPTIRTLVITLYRDSQMTESSIERFLKTFGIYIAASTISIMITENHTVFHQEKEDIIKEGLKSTEYQHIDDTGCRVNGKNNYAHIICNPFYTAFFTRPKKDRLTLLELLCVDELKFSFNDESYKLMTELGLADSRLNDLKTSSIGSIVSRHEVDNLLLELFPDPKKHSKNRRVILEASAIVYYQASEYSIEHLMCDDAPQFNRIAKHKALCWIHEGRHYKKLSPVCQPHIDALENFIGQFWDYYKLLLDYKENPSDVIALSLNQQFDLLFSTKTGYDDLDKRIALTLAKKESLLLVLIFVFLPLHNNPAELGTRVQARMRDVNLHTISDNGTKSKDTFATLVQTAKKLGVNFFHYIFDRVTKKNSMKSLAQIIKEKSTPLIDSC